MPPRPLGRLVWSAALACCFSAPALFANVSAYVVTTTAPRIVNLSPLAGSARNLPATGITLRFDRLLTPRELGALELRVAGSGSGVHAGRIVLADDERTVIFRPNSEFARGERVSVTVNRAFAASATTGPASFTFDVAASAPPALTAETRARLLDLRPGTIAPEPGSGRARAGSERADDLPADFPLIHWIGYSPPAPGRLFISAFDFTQANPTYLMILDALAHPIFYRRMDNWCLDWKLQPNGTLTYYDFGAGAFVALDSSYQYLRSYSAGNGYGTDTHELRLLPNGHALLLSYDPEIVDMGVLVPGGDPNATVIGLIIQEIDTAGNVVFQWRSWDHFAVTDATLEDLTAPVIDYVHGNAIEIDADGDLLLSSRHMDEITKISRQTGDIVWRWGGKHNEFTFVGDTLMFSHQHAIRRIANGHYTLFDNGNGHPVPYSRAVEYALDPGARVAQAVWQYRHTPDIYGNSMGYAQRLEDGHTLICWGSGSPNVTEVDGQGNIVLDLALPAGEFTYRAYRDEWSSPEWLGVRDDVPAWSLGGNPIRGSTVLSLSLDHPSAVTATVYDVQGRPVRKLADGERHDHGVLRLALDLNDRPTGIYFVRVAVGTHVQTRRVALIR